MLDLLISAFVLTILAIIVAIYYFIKEENKND